MYNGHKKVLSIKFQSIVTPNGLSANLYGPVEGKRHDSAMLAQSQVLNQLQGFSFNPHGDILFVYGDPAYPLRPQLQCPFRVARLTNIQKAWNKSMSQLRVSVEWPFGDVVNYFKFLDFKKNLKICRWQNIYYMCSNAQCPGMFVWLHYFRVFPDVPPNCPGLLSVIKRTLLKI